MMSEVVIHVPVNKHGVAQTAKLVVLEVFDDIGNSVTRVELPEVVAVSGDASLDRPSQVTVTFWGQMLFEEAT